MTNRRFDELFGGPPREPESTLEQRHMDLAASIQAVTEEVDAADRPRAASRRPGMKQPGAGRRRRAELRGQRPAAARRARSTTSGSSRPPATPAARSARRCSSGISCSSKPRTADGQRLAEGQLPRTAASTSTEIAAVPRQRQARRTSASTTKRSCSSTSPACWPTGRSSAGSRAGWSSARGPSAPEHPRRPALAARCRRR